MRLGGLVLSLRGAVIALVASASSVLVLAGIAAGVFATPSPDPSFPVDQPVTRQAPPPPVIQAAPIAPPVQALPPGPAAPPVADPKPAPADPLVVVARPKPAYHKPVTQPVSYRPPVQRQPPPAAHQPAPRPQPGARPPASASPEPTTKSRTVNTEPCNCDGHMRKVPTHWDPPRG